MWFYTGPHIPGTLNGCHGLGHSILSVTLYQRCCYDQRMWESTVFETLRVLSVLLITVFTRMPVAQSKLSPPCCWYLVPPKHAAAMQGFFKLDLSIYWHSRWTSSSDCSASGNGRHPPAMVMWNPRSPLCDLHRRVRHQKHLERPKPPFRFPALPPVITNHHEIARSDLVQESLSNLQLLPAQKYLTHRQDISLQ